MSNGQMFFLGAVLVFVLLYCLTKAYPIYPDDLGKIANVGATPRIPLGDEVPTYADTVLHCNKCKRVVPALYGLKALWLCKDCYPKT